MNKKLIIPIIAFLIIIAGLVIVLSGPSYNENSGNIVPTESNLTFKYNNDYSSSLYFTYAGGTDSAYYDKKTLNGTMLLDLNIISWDDNFTSTNESARVDANYAKEHFIEDMDKDFNSLKKEVNIIYYDENKTEVDVVDYSVDQEAISNNITLESNKLKVDLFKDYQKDYVVDILDGTTENIPMTAGKATKINTIKSAKIEIKLSNEEYCYHINIDVPSDKFNVTHF